MTATTIIPANLKLGQQVNIESRTWPGINKPGGHATITKLHYDDDDNTNNGPTRIDVKYVLGGTEKQIEMTYVKPHVELARGGRSRRVDKKLTVDSFTSSSGRGGRGGKENDGGGGVGKRGNKQNSNSGNNKRKADGLQKKKKVVSKKSKGADDTAVVTAAKIEEEEETVVKDDDAAQKKTTKKSAPPKKTGKKNAASSASAGASNKTKSIASYFASAGASASSGATTTSAKARVASKSKAKESTKNIKKASTSTATTAKPTKKTNPTATKKSTTTKSSPKIKYSPNSILAVRAAHAKSPAKSHIFGTKTIGSLSGFAFPGSSGVQESLFPDEREEEQRRTFAAATALNATSSTTTAAAATAARSSRKKKETPTSSGKKRGTSSTSLSKDKSAQNHKMMQSLYKNECVKAQEFVKSMVGSDTKKEEEEDGSGTMSVNSSPESLELEMDSGRMNLFNKLLSEVMFRKGLDSMEVDEMISSINTSSQRDSSTKPFTLLEVKAFLQELDSQNRIFVSWEEDNTGTIYSI